MKKTIVNYQKDWDCEGYVITQTIKLDRELLNPIQNELQRVKDDATQKCCTYIRDTTNQLSDAQLNAKRCIGITNLSVIKSYLTRCGLDNERVLTHRNTRIIFY